MGTINKVDYAAAYRQFATYGNGRSLKQFCTDEDFDYSRLRRYATKSFWNQQMNQPNSRLQSEALIPLEVDSRESISEEKVASPSAKKSILISDINVHLSNGLELRLHEGNMDTLMEVLHKILA